MCFNYLQDGTTLVDIIVSKQGPDGELKGAKALWLTVFTKVLFALESLLFGIFLV